LEHKERSLCSNKGLCSEIRPFFVLQSASYFLVVKAKAISRIMGMRYSLLWRYSWHFVCILVHRARQAGPGERMRVMFGKTKIGLALVASATALLTPLVSAQEFHLRLLAATGTVEEIRRALPSSAEINKRDVDGVSTLMLAARSNRDSSVIAVLVGAGADINARTKNGETALIFAVENNQGPDMISALLAAGADIHDRDRLGRTTLIHAALENQNPDLITFLLKAGADLNARDSDGRTALMYAAWVNPNPQVLARILTAGADARMKSNDGTTAADYARRNAAVRESDVLASLENAAK
jgi:hypothetical protein